MKPAKTELENLSTFQLAREYIALNDTLKNNNTIFATLTKPLRALYIIIFLDFPEDKLIKLCLASKSVLQITQLKNNQSNTEIINDAVKFIDTNNLSLLINNPDIDYPHNFMQNKNLADIFKAISYGKLYDFLQEFNSTEDQIKFASNFSIKALIQLSLKTKEAVAKLMSKIPEEAVKDLIKLYKSFTSFIVEKLTSGNDDPNLIQDTANLINANSFELFLNDPTIASRFLKNKHIAEIFEHIDAKKFTFFSDEKYQQQIENFLLNNAIGILRDKIQESKEILSIEQARRAALKTDITSALNATPPSNFTQLPKLKRTTQVNGNKTKKITQSLIEIDIPIEEEPTQTNNQISKH
jgi:hypothetical protein